MNKQELIEAVKELPANCSGPRPLIDKLTTLELIKLLDESTSGHAEEAPRYVKNVLARLRELPAHDREVWLKAIMSEFEQDFSRAKWREGYEKGKFEGTFEREIVTIPQFVADWIEKCKTFKSFAVSLSFALQPNVWEANRLSDECVEWLMDAENQDLFARAWLDGYEVEKDEKEKRYLVKIKATGQCLGKYYINNEILSPSFIYTGRNADGFTREELEQSGFSWVFDCPGIEIEEVEE